MGRKKNLENRQRILDAARRLFHERGFQGASMDDVARAAGVKKANLFHYYPSKEALALAVVDDASEHLKQRIRRQCCGEGLDPVEAVARIFAENAGRMRQAGCCRGCFMGNLAQELSDHNDKLRDKVAQHFRFWTGQLSGLLICAQGAGYFRRDLACERAAEAILALLEGSLLFCKASKRVGALENAKAMAVTYLESYKA